MTSGSRLTDHLVNMKKLAGNYYNGRQNVHISVFYGSISGRKLSIQSLLFHDLLRGDPGVAD